MLYSKNESSFLALYRLHSHSIQRLVRSMINNRQISEEITQDAFLKAWNSLPQFGFKSSLKTWVYRIAVNTTLDWIRQHKNAQKWIESQLESETEQTKETIALEKALHSLPENSRVILILNYYDELNQKEIAQILKIPEGTVKSRLYHAKKELRQILVTQGFDV